jgi:hypothetical protein
LRERGGGGVLLQERTQIPVVKNTMERLLVICKKVYEKRKNPKIHHNDA